jgi:hypothetical protein
MWRAAPTMYPLARLHAGYRRQRYQIQDALVSQIQYKATEPVDRVSSRCRGSME